MPQHDNNIEQALAAALGKAKYYIDTPGKKEGERYYWFPTQGDSMTDHTAQSIPAGSLVLGRWVPLNTIQDIPLHRPIVVVINDGGQQFCMLKIACAISTPDRPEADDDAGSFCLRSYNKKYDDFRLPFSCVKFIFVVERVRLADGSEFVPE